MTATDEAEPDTAEKEATDKSLVSKIGAYLPHLGAGAVALIFLDSLRFKFTNAPETQTIFGKLNDWAAGFGADGLFGQTGLFSQYVIGTAELFASVLLVIGIYPACRRLQVIGALIAFAVISGALGFHLWTPLGIDPNNDGGGLFIMAIVVWLISLSLIIIRRRELGATLSSIGRSLFPARS